MAARAALTNTPYNRDSMQLPDVELSELRYFHAVATAGSFADGARRSHVSPAAVSKAIKKLEDRLGASLFDRSGRTVQLTAAGDALLEHALVVFRALEELGAAVDATHGELAGPLRIGTTEEFIAQALPVALARLVEQHPGVVPHVYSMGRAAIERHLVDGTLDIGLVAGHADVPNTLEVQRLITSPTSLVCGARHPLFRVDPLPSDALQQHGFVATASFDEAPSRARNTAATVERTQMAIQMVVEGSLLGTFPDVMIRCQLNHAELRRLNAPTDLPSVDLLAVTRPSPATAGKTTALIELLEVSLSETLSQACAT